MILILGAGFLGLSLYKFFKGNGLDVKLYSRKLQPEEAHYPNMEGNIEVILDYPEIFYGVHTVIHAVHTTVPATSGVNPIYDIQSNVIPLLKILDACQKFSIDNFIYISSGGAVYGNHGNKKVSEEDCCRPISSYGATKLMSENYLRINQRKVNNSMVVLRPSNVYGFGQNLYKPQGVIGHILKSIYSEKTLEIWGDGNSLKDYLHVEDFVRGVFLLLQNIGSLQGFDVFNMGSHQLLSVNQIISFVEKITNKTLSKAYLQAKDFDVKSVNINSSKFMNRVSWQAKEDFFKKVEIMHEQNAKNKRASITI